MFAKCQSLWYTLSSLLHWLPQAEFLGHSRSVDSNGLQKHNLGSCHRQRCQEEGKERKKLHFIAGLFHPQLLWPFSSPPAITQWLPLWDTVTPVRPEDTSGQSGGQSLFWSFVWMLMSVLHILSLLSRWRGRGSDLTVSHRTPFPMAWILWELTKLTLCSSLTIQNRDLNVSSIPLTLYTSSKTLETSQKDSRSGFAISVAWVWITHMDSPSFSVFIYNMGLIHRVSDCPLDCCKQQME